MADVPHYCSACGEIHGGSSAESPEVKIAKINAERDIEVAKLSRAEMREMNEARTEQTALEAEAQVAEAVVEAAVLEEIVTPPEPEPEAEPEPEPEPVMIEPPADEEVPPPAETEHEPASSGRGFWSGYASS